jgi:serine/threonine protein kinase
VVHHFRPVLSRSRPREESMPIAAVSSSPRRTMDPKEQIDDRYEKLKIIGSGGIGTVYLARQAPLNRHVALKEIRELFSFFTEPQRMEIVRRFEEEVLKAARLFHPHIATILDGNISRDYPYVVTELVDGGNLRRIISRAETLPPELVIKIFLQVLRALGHAHRMGVIHRGLKPENILFDDSGNVRVTDFGVARVVERDQNVIPHVYVGVGSVGYMAPELYKDPSNVGPQSDLYALGIILYEMFARKLPGRRSPMPSEIHEGLPKVIDDLFDRLTQDEREDRFQSVDEALEMLYQSDAAKTIASQEKTMWFLDNPIAKLVFKEEPIPNTAEPPPPLAPSQSNPDLKSNASAPSSSEGKPILRAGSNPLLSAGAQGPASGSSPSNAAALTPPAGLSLTMPQVPPLVGSSSAEQAFLGEELSEEDQALEDLDVDDEGEKRRSRISRPYSFQQRLKDRDR